MSVVIQNMSIPYVPINACNMNFVFPIQFAPTGFDSVLATCLTPLTRNSLNSISRGIHIGISCLADNMKNAVRMSILSAMGSMNVPNIDFCPYFLAIFPSSQSVIIAIMNIIAAAVFSITPSLSSRPAIIGMSRILMIVSMLGIFISCGSLFLFIKPMQRNIRYTFQLAPYGGT